MLTSKEVAEIKDELLTAKRPIFFFHDDPDGLASFLLLYRFVKEGKGVVVKAAPRITEQFFARKVEEYDADKVFVLDIAIVEQEFINAVKVPVIWLDHHAPIKRENVKYYNPQIRGKNIPTPSLCWQVIGKERPQDIWIATVGCIGDWFIPDFADEFREKYPRLLPDEIKKPEDALFASKAGLLAKIFSFNLKGSTSEVLKSMKILTRIESPGEILNQETSRGRLIYKRYEKINSTYDDLMELALKAKKKGNIIMFTYTDDRLSLTKDLSNELLYKFPDKVIVLGRERSGEVRCSLRSGKKINLLKGVEKALVGIEGYGGGHEQACGAAIKKHDFERFVENLRKELNL